MEFKEFQIPLFSLVFFISIIFLYLHNVKKKRSPPFPQTIPILGNLHLFWKHSGDFFKSTNYIHDRYGDIVQVKLGFQEFIIVSDVSAAREILQTRGHHFANRPTFKSHEMLMGDRQQSMHLNDWTSNHRMIRKEMMLNLLTHYSDEVMEKFEKASIHTFNNFINSIQVNKMIKKSDLEYFVHTSMIEFITGKRLQASDERFAEFIRASERTQSGLSRGQIVDLFPFLAKISLFQESINKFIPPTVYIREFITNDLGQQEVYEKLRYRDPMNDSKPKYFLEHVMKGLVNDSVDVGWEKCFYVLVSALLGSQTILSNLLPVLIFLSRDKRIQEKIFTEISEKFEDDEGDLIKPSKVKEFLYIQACINETARLIGDPAIPHISTKNMVIKGFDIPKGSAMLINLPRIHRSTKLWNEPEHFRPERFLQSTADGTMELIKPPNFIPFGLGPRSCPGYGLHKATCGMVIANLIRKFILIDRGSNGPSIGPKFDLCIDGEAFRIELMKRKSY
ncbi:cytochrome P450 307a1-like [Brevipalpus obovatus]|uniref:cytochrome P450 307a1-like n=1 Tax=Brevipalpus obovatus TaxID=246614 RepID=UPI003D9F72ED